MRQWASERRLFFPDGGFQHPTALKLIRTQQECLLLREKETMRQRRDTACYGAGSFSYGKKFSGSGIASFCSRFSTFF